MAESQTTNSKSSSRAHESASNISDCESKDAILSTLCKEVPIPYIDKHSVSIHTVLALIKVGLSTYSVFFSGAAALLTTQLEKETSVIHDIAKKGIWAFFHCYRWVSYLRERYSTDIDCNAIWKQHLSIIHRINEATLALTRNVQDEYIQSLVKEKEEAR